MAKDVLIFKNYDLDVFSQKVNQFFSSQLGPHYAKVY